MDFRLASAAQFPPNVAAAPTTIFWPIFFHYSFKILWKTHQLNYSQLVDNFGSIPGALVQVVDSSSSAKTPQVLVYAHWTQIPQYPTNVGNIKIYSTPYCLFSIIQFQCLGSRSIHCSETIIWRLFAPNFPPFLPASGTRQVPTSCSFQMWNYSHPGHHMSSLTVCSFSSEVNFWWSYNQIRVEAILGTFYCCSC